MPNQKQTEVPHQSIFFWGGEVLAIGRWGYMILYRETYEILWHPEIGKSFKGFFILFLSCLNFLGYPFFILLHFGVVFVFPFFYHVFILLDCGVFLIICLSFFILFFILLDFGVFFVYPFLIHLLSIAFLKIQTGITKKDIQVKDKRIKNDKKKDIQNWGKIRGG